MISVVIPAYNEENTIAEIHKRIVEVMQKQKDSYEIIIVDDGSGDNTWKKITNLHPVKGISLQRNYGQTPALDVGIREARGDTIIFIDADLQNDPKDILNFLEKIDEGFDVVVGWRKERKDSIKRILFSRIANKFTRTLLGLKIHDFGCGIKVYKSRFIKDFRLWGDAQVFLPAVAKKRGAKICELKIAHYPRTSGASKIKILNLIKGSFDLLGIAFFIKYFTKPLRFFGGIGLFSVFLSFLSFGASLILRARGIANLSQTPLPTIGVLFAILGVMLFMMGFLAEILLRMYYENINSSLYLIRETKTN